MPYGLKKEDLKKILKIFRSHSEIKAVLLFGSRALESGRPGSDIDLALLGNEITHKNLLSLKKDLNNLNLPYKFDALIYSKISEPDLKDHIDRLGIELFNSIDSKN